MESSALRQALDDLCSETWTHVQQAAEETGRHLRSGTSTPAEVADAGARLRTLTRHPKWEVRKAVAYALQHLRHESYHPALAELLRDQNASVRDAAWRTRTRRSEQAHADVLEEEHEAALLRWLSELEGRHGPRARSDALRVADRYADLLMGETHHEMIRLIAPLDAALMQLDSALDAKTVDRQRAKRELGRARARLECLIAGLRSVRAYTRSEKLEFERAPLREVLEAAVAIVREQPGEGLPLRARLSVSRTLSVVVSTQRLTLAFANLIHNAAESYAGSERSLRVRVSAHADGAGGIVITVRDCGRGMSAENVRDCVRLFATSKPGSTGVGLPLAKKIIESEHGGSLSISSQEGQGTLVTVVLPTQREPSVTHER